MRLQSIRLRWFRGAAADATLDLGGRSVAIYGTNGAGKSSFVDGVEAILGNGKVAI
jgi:recombinational DNA repair ATPase RecF